MENSNVIVKDNRKMVKKPNRKNKSSAAYPPPAKISKDNAYYQLCENSNILVQKEQINAKGEKCIDVRAYCPLNMFDQTAGSNHLIHTKTGIRLSYFQCEKLMELLKLLLPPGPHLAPVAYFQDFQMPGGSSAFLLKDGKFVSVE